MPSTGCCYANTDTDTNTNTDTDTDTDTNTVTVTDTVTVTVTDTVTNLYIKTWDYLSAFKQWEGIVFGQGIR